MHAAHAADEHRFHQRAQVVHVADPVKGRGPFESDERRLRAARSLVDEMPDVAVVATLDMTRRTGHAAAGIAVEDLVTRVEHARAAEVDLHARTTLAAERSADDKQRGRLSRLH